MDILLDLDFNLNVSCGKTDEELAALAKTDRDAAAVLMSRYARLISIKSEIFATPETGSDDLRQEGLLTLLKAINTYDSTKGARFCTYAEVCIVNRMRSLAARAKKQPVRSDDLHDVIGAKEMSVEETPESIYLYKEFISELWSGIDSMLSPVERKSLNHVMNGLSYRQAAEKMGVSEKSVDNAVQRARRKLRALMIKLNMTV